MLQNVFYASSGKIHFGSFQTYFHYFRFQSISQQVNPDPAPKKICLRGQAAASTSAGQPLRVAGGVYDKYG
jgi:hypothetical protein